MPVAGDGGRMSARGAVRVFGYGHFRPSIFFVRCGRRPDDLPTLRREREAREREARGGRRERAATMPAGYHSFVPPFGDAQALLPGTVTRLDLPFLHLMAFFLKAVFAAVPALLVLCAMIWGAAHAVLAWYPELVKMQILILFPPG